jgi:acetylornithine/N-succinyldiaminopimelate aminotransferase
VNVPAGEGFVMPTYARYPLTLVRGEGRTVWDDEGADYLDAAGALGANPLGHGHPAWKRAVHDQVEKLDLTSNLFFTLPQAELARRLADLLPIPEARTFFCNSGAEANEAAIKLARRHGLAAGRPAILALEGSFHGRTIATLAATGQPAKRAPFEPLVDWFRFVPPNDVSALRGELGVGDVGAVLLEPVLGEGGVRPLTPEYLQTARELCDLRGALLVADEVQSGVGRCGDWLAVSLAGVVPDIVTLAKALAGGLPIGACVARAELAFEAGAHGSTFGGGPIPCAAALAVLDVIEAGDLLARARELGGRLRNEITRLSPPGLVAEVRGRGLLIGVQLARPLAHEVVLAMIGEGVLATEAGPDVVRMSPALTVTAEEIDVVAKAFVAAVGSVVDAAEPAP